MSTGASITDRIEDKLKNAVVHGLLAVAVMLIRPLATLTEIFFRKDMGERYFNTWNVTGGYFLLAVFGSPYRTIAFGTEGGYDVLDGRYHRAAWGMHEWRPIIAIIVWSAALGFFATLQQTAVVKRYREGKRWHSLNVGLPRFPMLPYAVEKTVPIVAGVLLMWLLQLYGLGFLMILSGGTSLLLRAYEAMKFKERILDVIDGQIEQEHLAQAVKERLLPEKVEGLQTPLPTYISEELRGNFVTTR